MNARTAGTFTVELTPQKPDSPVAETAGLGRMSLDKRFSGGLDATSAGEMLSAMGSVQGSAGYVAMERVRGTLDGRMSGFVLKHDGTMTRGAPSLLISVVPDSGTDALTGLAGTMAIEIEGGLHRYAFDYSLPDA